MQNKEGHIHPIQAVVSEVVEYFDEIGYSVATGPEMEDEYYNFEALNIPKGHPAREMWDTFWIKGCSGKLMRTHTSPVQIRYMEEFVNAGKQFPLKAIVPGKVFRNEATDATHEAQFHQLEGICIGENIGIGDLKATLEYFVQKLFGDGVEMRYRPSYFPFTEPSIEVDLKMPGTDKWLEVLGAGMVHPFLFEKVEEKTGKKDFFKGKTGFAFGIGLDRIVKMRYNIDDIRHLYRGDLRFLTQF